MQREPRFLTHWVRRAAGIRLTVFLPLLLMSLTIAVGFWAIYLTTGSLGVGRPRLRTVQDVQALREIIFLVVGVGGGLALALGIALGLSISRPIRELLRRVEELLPPSLAMPPLKRIDELSKLTNTLNHLLLSFEKYATQAGLLDHLPEGRARTFAREIRRVDRLAALGALGASVVHEIGGSVQAIRTLVDLITPLIPRESAEHRYVEKIDAELERVRHLADEIRTLAQVEPRERVSCRVESLVADALWMVESRFRGKKVRVVKRIPARLPALSGDPDRLNRAILNVLVNAFEATPQGGQITVTVAENELPSTAGPGSGIVLRVANTGSSLSPEEQERVFDLFYTTKKEGSGLGLPVAYRAVEDHGGTISVRSSVEEGTEFSIFLPIAVADAPP